VSNQEVHVASNSEDFVRTPVESTASIIEERTVQDDGIGSRVVHTATTATRVPTSRATYTVRRWWRRERAAPVGGEYVTASSYALDENLAQVLRIAWFLFGLLEALLALRFILSLLGANERNDFAATVYGMTALFVAPFRTLFPTSAASASPLEIYTLVAMLVYFVGWRTAVKMIGAVFNRSVDP
jgi:uncharacterized protein YggT (Ycf19 family)